VRAVSDAVRRAARDYKIQTVLGSFSSSGRPRREDGAGPRLADFSSTTSAD